VRDRVLLRAVLDGYASLVQRGHYPIAVLFLAAPAGELDVNVHPAKLEVRFRQPAAIHQLVAPALRARLTASLAPTAPPGQEPTAVGERPPAYGSVPTSTLTLEPAALPLWRPAPRGFASLRFIGQIFEGYLLCEGEGRVVLIDQHAAHERVVYERLHAERRTQGVPRDPLLVPETIELPPAQVAALAEHAAALEAAGLEGEPFGAGTFLLRTTPRALAGQDVAALLRAVAAELSYLPLGLTLAGAVIADRHLRYSRYLERLAAMPVDLTVAVGGLVIFSVCAKLITRKGELALPHEYLLYLPLLAMMILSLAYTPDLPGGVDKTLRFLCLTSIGIISPFVLFDSVAKLKNSIIGREGVSAVTK